MTRQEFIDFQCAFYSTLNKMTATKGAEYANDDRDQLANFRRVGAELGLEARQVCMVFLNKHLDAIKHYVRTWPASCTASSEPLHMRCIDAVLYLILLDAILTEDEQERVALKELQP